MDIQATFPYFGQVNPLRVVWFLVLPWIAVAETQGGTRMFTFHVGILWNSKVFVQSTILNQADVGNELVPGLEHVCST